MGLLLYYLGIVATYVLGGLPTEAASEQLDPGITILLIIVPSVAMGYIGYALFTAPGLAGGTLLAAQLGENPITVVLVASMIAALLGLVSYYHPLISRYIPFGKPDAKIFAASVVLSTAVTAAAILA